MAERTTPPAQTIDPARKYTATVHTSRGDFVIDIVEPKVAPQTVNNFVVIAQEHYYDGLTFHRVVPGFVVQGGAAHGNPTPGVDDFHAGDGLTPVTYPDGLKYVDLSKGTGAIAHTNDIVVVQY